MYYLNIFPLEEQYKNNASTDELIIDPKTGHITIKTPSGYSSESRTLEAELNGLLSLKDRFYNEYIQISDELEDAVNKLNICRENIRTINATIADCISKLNRINVAAEALLKTYDKQYRQYNKYLYADMENFRRLTRENIKKVIYIENIIDEIILLHEDMEDIRYINNKRLEYVKENKDIVLK